MFRRPAFVAASLLVPQVLVSLLLLVPPASGANFFSDSFDPAPLPGWTATGAWHMANDSLPDPCFGSPVGNHPLASASFPNSFGYHYDIAPPAIPGNACTYDLDGGGGIPATNSGNLTSPTIDLSAATAPVWLHLSTWRETQDNPTADTMRVYLNTGSGPAEVLQVLDPASPQTVWETVDVDISSAAGNASVVVTFRFDTVNSLFNDYPGWYVDNVSIDDLAPGANTLTATLTEAAPPTVLPGDSDVLFAILDVAVDGGSATLDNFTVNLSGSPPLESDILLVSLWEDDGDSVYDPPFDPFVDSATFTGGVATLRPGWIVFVATPVRFYITYDIAAGALVGDFVGVGIASATNFSVSVPDLVVCASCPFDTYDGIQTEIVAPVVDNVSFTLVDLAPATATVGQPNVVMAAVDAAVDNNTAVWNLLQVDLTGIPPDPLDVANVTLWLDDGDSAFDSFQDTVVDSTPVTNVQENLLVLFPITAGLPRRFFLTYDLEPTAVGGHFVGIRFPVAAAFDVQAPDMAVCANCPFDTYNGTKTEILGGPTIDTLIFTPADLSPLTVQVGQPDALMARVDLSVDNNTATVDALTLNLTGNPPATADLLGATVWLDGGDGTFTLSDETAIGGGLFTVGPLTVFLFPRPVVTAPTITTLWVSYDISPGATIGNHVGVSIENASWLVVFSPDLVACVACPLNTYDGAKTLIVAAPNVPPEARSILVDGFASGTPEIAHLPGPSATFAWGYSDPDGGSHSDSQVRVGSAPGLSDVWAPPPMGSPSTTAPYGGPVLSASTDYWLGVRVHDGTDWSAWNETRFRINGLPPDPSPPVTPPDGGTVPAGSGTTVSWTGGADPDSDPVTYEWEVATDAGFTAILASGSGGSTTSGPFTTLPSTMYFWRVRAGDGWGWSNRSGWTFNTSAVVNNAPEARALTVNGFSPGSPGIVHILSANPSFAWTYEDPELMPQTDFEVRVGSAPGLADVWAPGPAGASGLSIPYGGTPLMDGIDYWFAVRVRDDAVWSPWNETMAHTNAPPSSTGLVVEGFASPSAGIGHILLAAPTFNWTASDADADVQTDYEVRVGTAPGGSGVWSPGPTAGSGSSVIHGGTPLLDAADYWLGVRVRDGWEWSVWTEVPFHTNGVPPAPSAPVSPPDLAVIPASGAQNVSWTAGGVDPEGDGVTFEWQVATDAAFTPILTQGGGAGTMSSFFATAPGLTYYWRARAHDGYEYSSWSAWRFDTEVPNTPPDATYLGVDGFLPGDAGLLHIHTPRPTLNWTYFDLDGDVQARSDVQIGTAAGLGDVWAPGPMAGANTSAIYGGPALAVGTDYFFGARVYDGAEWSPWVETRFHTNTPPPAPSLTSPAVGTTDVAFGTVSLEWAAVVDAEDDGVLYLWEASTSPTFAALEGSGTTAAANASLDASASTTYFWRVRANDSWETGPYSLVRNFTTASPLGSIRVTVSGAGGPIGGSQVELRLGSTVLATGATAADGRFTFTNVSLGTYSVHASASGYQGSSTSVTLSAGAPDAIVTLELQTSPAFPFELLLLLLIVVFAVAMALVLWRRRRMKPTEEPPSAETPDRAETDDSPESEPPANSEDPQDEAQTPEGAGGDR